MQLSGYQNRLNYQTRWLPLQLALSADIPPDNMMPFPTGGDMLQFLYQSGDITDKDGLQVTWYHAANKKSEMEEALKSKYSFPHIAAHS